MECPYCGKQYRDPDQVICEYCGLDLPKDASPASLKTNPRTKFDEFLDNTGIRDFYGKFKKIIKDFEIKSQ
jgi:hypothetical protein